MSAAERSYARRFVPVQADMGDWRQIEPLFDELERRPIGTRAELESWLEDVSDLAACLSEESSKRHVAMTCQTDDPEKERAYLYFVEEIAPKCKPRWQRLREKYVASPARRGLPSRRYMVYDRSTVSAVEIFRQENVPLQTEDEKLDQQYQKVCGAMTVQYGGKEQTLQQMARYLREPDRQVRQRSWELVAERRLADRERLDAIFDEMLRLRSRMAVKAGFANFRDYQFKAYERFDYTPEDCFRFHDAIAKIVVPAARRVQEHRRQTLGLERLRPWDLAVDPHNRPPLRPFRTAGELCEKCSKIFRRISPELGRQFEEMVGAGWLDLESRKGKAPGGYQATFDETRHPFIFMNAVGLHADVETLLHEGGHAFHAVACRDEPLMQYRHCGMEMAEVASMGMELLAFDHLEVFYQGEELERARREQLEGIIGLFPWVATIDRFQHWLYTNPRAGGTGCSTAKSAQAEGRGSLPESDELLDREPRATSAVTGGSTEGEARTAYWLSLLDRFGGIEDWSGYEAARAASWQRQLHLYGVPFYYVEYAIAQIGALQLWQNARADTPNALRQYREALALGGSRPLPELWEAAGLRFDFGEATLRPLVEAVERELERLR